MSRRVILRARIGLDVPSGCDPVRLEDHLAEAIIIATQHTGAVVTLLQLGPTIDKEWAFEGPSDRVSALGALALYPPGAT